MEAEDLEWAEAGVREAGAPVPLETLERSFRRLTGRAARLGGLAIANLLRDLGEGADFEDAFARRILRSFGEFQESLATPSR